MTAPTAECSYCVDGLSPWADAVVGLMFVSCPECGGAYCGSCDGEGVFPAAPTDVQAVIRAMNARGFVPIFCPSCMGITSLVAKGGGQ